MNLRFCFDGQVYGLEIEPAGTGYRAVVDGREYRVDLEQLDNGAMQLRIGERTLDIRWAADGPLRWIWLDGSTYLLDKRTTLVEGAAGAPGAQKTLRAPMPGQVREVSAAAGEEVTKGQTLVLLEAMKMEIRIQAPQDGQVAQVLVEAGESVDRDQALVEMS